MSEWKLRLRNAIDLNERAKTWLANIGTTLVTVILFFVILEVALWAGVVPYDPGVRAETIHCSGSENLHEFHPEYGWTLSSGASYIRHWKHPTDEDPYYLYTINKDGFRDTYDTGENDIIVLGDSFTEGAGVTEGGQYDYLLDRWAQNTSFHAYAAGGYGTDQQYLIYQNVSDQHNHDLVIVQYYFGNDAKNNVGEGWPPGPRRPRFELQDGELVQVHEPEDRIPSDAAGFRDYGTLGRIHQTFRDTSRAYDWTYRRARTIASRGDGSNEPPSPPTGDERERQLEITRALINGIAEEANANGADVLIVGVPARGEVTPSSPAHYPSEEGIPYYEDQRTVLQDAAKSNPNTEYLDLKPILKEEVAAGREVYGQEVANAHFVAYGYRVTARTIYKNIVSEGYVDKRSVDFKKDYRRMRRTCPSQ
jgi:hypothetical protein